MVFKDAKIIAFNQYQKSFEAPSVIYSYILFIPSVYILTVLDLWQDHYQVLILISLKKLIKLNVNQILQ